MTTRNRAPLAAVLGIMALILGHDALGQTPQDPGKGDLAPASSATPPIGEPAGWHTMTGPGGSFTAELPAAPTYTATPQQTAAGASYTMHHFLFEEGAVAYMIQTSIYPEDVRVTSHRTNLQGGLDNAARNMDGAKWASIGWLTHQGLTAVDAVGVRGGLAIRSYSVMKGRQVFTLTYAGPSGSARSDDANRFVASLRVGQ